MGPALLACVDLHPRARFQHPITLFVLKAKQAGDGKLLLTIVQFVAVAFGFRREHPDFAYVSAICTWPFNCSSKIIRI
jgi:hypothetical protein